MKIYKLAVVAGPDEPADGPRRTRTTRSTRPRTASGARSSREIASPPRERASRSSSARSPSRSPSCSSEQLKRARHRAHGPQRQARVRRARGRDRRRGRPPGRGHDRARTWPAAASTSSSAATPSSSPEHRARQARPAARRPGLRRALRRRAARRSRSASRPTASRCWRPAACSSSAPSATSRAASTTSCAAAPAARATRASRASSCPPRTTSCACSPATASTRSSTASAPSTRRATRSRSRRGCSPSRSRRPRSKVEEQNFLIRKRVLEYDDVMNEQRRDRLQVPRRGARGPRHGRAGARADRRGRSRASSRSTRAGDYVEDWDLDGLFDGARSDIWPVELRAGRPRPRRARPRRARRPLAEDARPALRRARGRSSATSSCARSSATCCCRSSTSAGASTSTTWTTCARASTCAGSPRSTRSSPTRTRPSTLFSDLMNTIWSDFARMIFHVEVEVEGADGGAGARRAAVRPGAAARRRPAASRVLLGRRAAPRSPARSARGRGCRARRAVADGRREAGLLPPWSSSAASTSTSRSAATTRAGAGRARSSRSATARSLTPRRATPAPLALRVRLRRGRAHEAGARARVPVRAGAGAGAASRWRSPPTVASRRGSPFPASSPCSSLAALVRAGEGAGMRMLQVARRRRLGADHVLRADRRRVRRRAYAALYVWVVAVRVVLLRGVASRRGRSRWPAAGYAGRAGRRRRRPGARVHWLLGAGTIAVGGVLLERSRGDPHRGCRPADRRAHGRGPADLDALAQETCDELLRSVAADATLMLEPLPDRDELRITAMCGSADAGSRLQRRGRAQRARPRLPRCGSAGPASRSSPRLGPGGCAATCTGSRSPSSATASPSECLRSPGRRRGAAWARASRPRPPCSPPRRPSRSTASNARRAIRERRALELDDAIVRGLVAGQAGASARRRRAGAARGGTRRSAAPARWSATSCGSCRRRGAVACGGTEDAAVAGPGPRPRPAPR